MTHPPELYLPRRIDYLNTMHAVGHQIKTYGIRCDLHPDSCVLLGPVADAVRDAVTQVLNEHACFERSYGMGFCVVHQGEEAVWLLVDWWTHGGILCQRMLSAPLSHPHLFVAVTAPALACVWELVVIVHERDAWVRHMMTATPDAPAYLADVVAAGNY